MLMRSAREDLKARVTALANVFTPPTGMDEPITRARVALKAAQDEVEAAKLAVGTIAKTLRPGEFTRDLDLAQKKLERASQIWRAKMQALGDARDNRDKAFAAAALAAFEEAAPVLEEMVETLTPLVEAISKLESYGSHRALSSPRPLQQFYGLQEGCRAITAMANFASGGVMTQE